MTPSDHKNPGKRQSMSVLRLLGLVLSGLVAAGCISMEAVRATYPLAMVHNSTLHGSPRDIAFCFMEETKNEWHVRTWGSEDGSIVKLQVAFGGKLSVFPIWEAKLKRVENGAEFEMWANSDVKGEFAAATQRAIGTAQLCGRG